MNGEEVFAALVRQLPGWLERPIEDLVKMQAVGNVYLDTHRSILRRLKSGQIELAEEDRKSRLAEGQAIGEALLDVETRIGELSLQEPSQKPWSTPEGGRPQRGGAEPLKHERLGISRKQMGNAQSIARHPEAVAQVKAEAKENEDIPTKTAVLNKIKADREKKLREKYERETKAKKANNTAQTTGEALKYLGKLREIVLLLPAKIPPEGWTDESFAEANAMVEIIRKRLEAWP